MASTISHFTGQRQGEALGVLPKVTQLTLADLGFDPGRPSSRAHLLKHSAVDRAEDSEDLN